MFNYKQTRQDTGNGGTQRKATKSYTKPQMDRFNGTFYLISDKVFRLNDLSTDPSLPYAEELTKDEVEQLPYKIVYDGPEMEFEADEEKFARIYTDILRDFMSMQNQEFISFPLGKGCSIIMYQFFDEIPPPHPELEGKK